jgi:hypothetical protein
VAVAAVFNYGPFGKGIAKGDFHVDVRVFVWSKIHEWWQVSETFCAGGEGEILKFSVCFDSELFWNVEFLYILAQSYYVNYISHIGTFNYLLLEVETGSSE